MLISRQRRNMTNRASKRTFSLTTLRLERVAEFSNPCRTELTAKTRSLLHCLFESSTSLKRRIVSVPFGWLSHHHQWSHQHAESWIQFYAPCSATLAVLWFHEASARPLRTALFLQLTWEQQRCPKPEDTFQTTLPLSPSMMQWYSRLPIVSCCPSVRYVCCCEYANHCCTLWNRNEQDDMKACLVCRW